MSDGSKISWLDRPGTKPASWNPIRARFGDKTGVHCEHASDGCRHCYAESRWNNRFGTQLAFTRQSRNQVDIFIDEKILTQPLHWTKPRTIFVCSTSDLFGEWMPDTLIDRVIATAAICPRHTFIVLTKRADRMRAYFNSRNGLGNAEICHAINEIPAELGNRHGALSIPLPNVWLGVTAENQEMANKRVPCLLDTPAAVRFVSCEPMLGPVNLTEIRNPEFCPYCIYTDALAGKDVHEDDDYQWTRSERLDWVICGGESGNGARPMHPDWARSLRDQCATAGLPFFFKQWGLWKPGPSGRSLSPDGTSPGPEKWDDPTTAWMSKDTCFSATGDQLDGERLHAWPEVQS